MVAIKKRIINRARNRLSAAITSGTIQRENACVLCGKLENNPQKANIEAHHPDYSKPLFIIWLCNRCHHKHHDDLEIINFVPIIEELREYLFRKDKSIISNRGLIRAKHKNLDKYRPAQNN